MRHLRKKGRAMPNAYVTAPDGTEVQFKTHNGLGHWVGAASTGDYAHPHVNLVSEFQAAAQVATKSELLESLTSPAITGNKHKHHAVRMALARLQTYVSKTPSVDAYLKLHCKLGHAGVRRVAEYAKAHGIELDPVARAFVQQCITCEVAKAKMHSKNKKDTGKLEAALPLWGKVFCDVWEPGKKIRSVRTGYKYIIGFIDAATNSGRIYGMISTKEVPTTIKRFLNDIHNERKSTTNFELVQHPGGVPNTKFNTDCAAYFVSPQTQGILSSYNCTGTASSPYHPEKNAKIERWWQTLHRMSQAQRKAYNLPAEFWYYSMRHAAMLYDILGCSANNGVSPYEARHNKRPKLLDKLHTFGAPAVVKRHAKSTKMDYDGVTGVYVGYDPLSNASMVYIKRSGNTPPRMVRTIDIKVFDGILPQPVLTGLVPVDAEIDDILPPPPSPPNGGVRLQEGEYIDFGIEQFPESIPARGKQYPVHQCQPPVPIQNMHQGDEVYVNAILEQYPSISNARKRARSGVLPMVEEANSKEWTDLETMGAIAWVRDRDVPKSERRFPSQMLLALKGAAKVQKNLYGTKSGAAQ